MIDRAASPSTDHRHDEPVPASWTGAPTTRGTTSHLRAWWATMAVTSLLGVASGLVVIVEKVALLKDPAAGAFCDLSSTIACSPVLTAWQSSVLGPPNAAIGIVLFAMFAAVGLGGAMGATYPPRFLGVMAGLDVLFLLFLTWYMTQVAFAIGSLCPFCVACTAALLATTLAMNRVVVAGHGYGRAGLARVMATATRDGIDVMVVLGWAAAIAGMLWVGIVL